MQRVCAVVLAIGLASLACGGASSPVAPTLPPPPVSCELSANTVEEHGPLSLPYGSVVNLIWRSSYAASCVLDRDAEGAFIGVEPNGSHPSMPIYASRKFTLRCMGRGGSGDVCSAVLVVNIRQ